MPAERNARKTTVQLSTKNRTGNHDTYNEAIDVDREAALETENFQTEYQTASAYYSMAVADARPGQMLHGGLLDLILRRIHDLAPEGLKAKWRIFSGLPVEPPRTDPGRYWMKPIWYSAHFILLVYDETGFTAYDSEPRYATKEREHNVKLVTKNEPFVLKNSGPQRLNDCGFHVAAAAARILGVPVPSPVTDIRGYFMKPIIEMMKERRNVLRKVALPSYSEHVRYPQQQTWVPPETLYEPSQPREAEDLPTTDVPVVADLGVFKALQRKTTAKPIRLVDDGDKEAIFDLGDVEVEEDCVLEAYPVTAEAAQEMGLTVGLAQITTFAELRRAVSQPRSQPHPLAKQALAETTRDEHLRVLGIIQHAPTEFDPMPIATGVLELFARTRQRRRWKWATLSKKLASAQGALRILPLYVKSAPIILSEIPEWKHGVKYATTRVKEEAPRAVRPMTPEQILAVPQDFDTRAAVALCWLVAARVGDILQLKGEDVVWNEADCTITITYRRGKTISKRGPFSVHCEVPVVWHELAQGLAQRATARAREKLLKVKVAAVTKALRAVDSALESRSLRRGALQAMAHAGVDEQELFVLLWPHDPHHASSLPRMGSDWYEATSENEHRLTQIVGGCRGGGYCGRCQQRPLH